MPRAPPRATTRQTTVTPAPATYPTATPAPATSTTTESTTTTTDPASTTVVQAAPAETVIPADTKVKKKSNKTKIKPKNQGFQPSFLA
ncbi:hypothetical protein [Hymenobacter siberiensis]|uniref:hypothetical protein n=1 Tax=Hymenobacter siberiensis TaxID=2848396 RepID=UPI001C1E160E|nr:hypothetical protein [Hymenobacter siberiensis]MBU6122152.1 hypothetical protein [Hymenobacter siberiensis]